MTDENWLLSLPVRVRLVYLYLHWRSIPPKVVEFCKVVNVSSQDLPLFVPEWSGALGDRAELVVKQGRVVLTNGDASTSLTEEAKSVVSYWISIMPGRSRSRVTPKRVKQVLARMRGVRAFSVVELRQALDGLAKSDWHSGRNPQKQLYNDVLWLCASDEQVERFMVTEAAEVTSARAAKRTFKEALEEEN